MTTPTREELERWAKRLESCKDIFGNTGPGWDARYELFHAAAYLREQAAKPAEPSELPDEAICHWCEAPLTRHADGYYVGCSHCPSEPAKAAEPVSEGSAYLRAFAHSPLMKARSAFGDAEPAVRRLLEISDELDRLTAELQEVHAELSMATVAASDGRNWKNLLKLLVDERNKLTAERDKLKLFLRHNAEDWAADRERIRNLVSDILPPGVITGDSHHVPDSTELVELALNAVAAERDRLREVLVAIRDSPHCHTRLDEPYVSESTSAYKLGVADGHRYCAEKARAALNPE